MTQDVVYPGECSMCTLEEGVLFCIWMECPEDISEIHPNAEEYTFSQVHMEHSLG